jgi:hypothetical protein
MPIITNWFHKVPHDGNSYADLAAGCGGAADNLWQAIINLLLSLFVVLRAAERAKKKWVLLLLLHLRRELLTQLEDLLKKSNPLHSNLSWIHFRTKPL